MPVVTVASLNPVKIQAARAGYEALFPGQAFSFRTVSVPSGVSEQPLTSAETLAGAKNRAEGARLEYPSADYWIGIEGGAELEEDQLAVFAWVFICSPTGSGQARTATFYVPPAVVDLVREGKELGEADDLVFGRNNSKQQEGAVGILSGGVLDRAGLYAQAVLLALLPFRNPQLFFSKPADG